MQFRYLIAGLALSAVLTSTLSAGQVALGPNNVIGGSNTYDIKTGSSAGVPWDQGVFSAKNVLDEQTGPINETFETDYWLNPDGGATPGYIVIDLGAPTKLTSVDLFNTHNGQYGDRGTGNFTITASNTITNLGSFGDDIVGGTVVLSGTLAAQPVSNPLTDQSFAITDPGTYRYIRFDALSVASSNPPCCGPNNFGLNEIRVNGTPEPASLSLIGLGAMGLLARRRHA